MFVSVQCSECQSDKNLKQARVNVHRAVAGAARPRRALCHLSTHIFPASLSVAFFVTPRNKYDMGDGVPTDQLSHNHCDCTDSYCNSHIVASCVFVLPFVPSPITSPPAAEAAQRLRRRRSTGRSRRARRAGPREARFVHVVDLARQSRATVFAWWNPCIIRPYCAADEGAGGAGQEGGSVCNLPRQSH